MTRLLKQPLLRARRERPRGCAAERHDELAPLHSITSSAVASSLSGTVRPSIRALSTLMTSSNLAACTTGHIMVDDDHGAAARDRFEQLHHLKALARAHAGERLVEQQETW